MEVGLELDSMCERLWFESEWTIARQRDSRGVYVQISARITRESRGKKVSDVQYETAEA